MEKNHYRNGINQTSVSQIISFYGKYLIRKHRNKNINISDNIWSSRTIFFSNNMPFQIVEVIWAKY